MLRANNRRSINAPVSIDMQSSCSGSTAGPCSSSEAYDHLEPHQQTLVIYFLYHMREILVCLIFFCSWKMPYISASDVGGHPGT